MLLKAFAKVNLFLEVVTRRDDRYHDVVTILQTISLYDDVELSLQPNNINLTCDNSTLPTNERNLAYRAAKLLKEKTGTKHGVKITLTKHIPVGAGLGGGSSNAAAVLVGCNELWNCKLSSTELADIGVLLGMDVPFFLRGGTALALGKGEKITQQLPTPKLVLVVVYPNLPVSTASVYKSLDIASVFKKIDHSIILSAIEINDTSKIANSLFNRLEMSTFSLYPRLVNIKKELIQLGCLNALMSGSGSAVFGIAPSKSHGETIARNIVAKHHFWVQLLETIEQYSI